MEVKRQKLGNGADGEFRARQLAARAMLRGELEGPDLDKHVEDSLLLDDAREGAELGPRQRDVPGHLRARLLRDRDDGIVGARVDVARFGFEAFRASPRQADLMIISGRVSIKMAPVVRRIYDQMLEPKWTIAMGACSSSMGVFNNYAIVPADKFMPVDVHVPGCPPRPEALMHGILKLRAAILTQPGPWTGAPATAAAAPRRSSSRRRRSGRGHSIGVSGGGRMGTSA